MPVTHRLQWLVMVTLLVGLVTLPILAQPAGTPTSNGKSEPPSQKVTIQPEKESWLFRGTDNLATLIGYVLVSFASLLAYRQWRADQQWKRLDALMERI